MSPSNSPTGLMVERAPLTPPSGIDFSTDDAAFLDALRPIATKPRVWTGGAARTVKTESREEIEESILCKQQRTKCAREMMGLAIFGTSVGMIAYLSIAWATVGALCVILVIVVMWRREHEFDAVEVRSIALSPARMYLIPPTLWVGTQIICVPIRIMLVVDLLRQRRLDIEIFFDDVLEAITRCGCKFRVLLTLPFVAVRKLQKKLRTVSVSPITSEMLVCIASILFLCFAVIAYALLRGISAHR